MAKAHSTAQKLLAFLPLLEVLWGQGECRVIEPARHRPLEPKSSLFGGNLVPRGGEDILISLDLKTLFWGSILAQDPLSLGSSPQALPYGVSLKSSKEPFLSVFLRISGQQWPIRGQAPGRKMKTLLVSQFGINSAPNVTPTEGSWAQRGG